MVRKQTPHERAKRGIIPTNDPVKDRARTVHGLFRKFHYRLDESRRIQMINKATEILEIGESDSIFDGRDPIVSGIAIFVYTCRRFSYECKCRVTYKDIREEFVHFSSGESFVKMLLTLSSKFD
ncbi:MAG TPA: hypothetical protein VN704_12175 [Verrucomicrobiae bacterium]|nr:hypothetical protein [Verrucomicrobiae bacterium]